MDTTSIHILIVDDEGPILELLKEALEQGGFTVATATSGEQAIGLLEAEDASFRALVTDVNLIRKKLTGWDVAKRGREINPELPVIYMTGADSHDWASNGLPNSVLVTKPFAAAQIVTAVAQLINVGNTPGA